MLPLSFYLFGFHADAIRKAFYFSWISTISSMVTFSS